MSHLKEELLSKIRVLEEENLALSEKVEYSVLLNVIAESTDSSEDINLIIESVLEKFCILKQLPFAAFFSLHEHEQKLENYYQLFGTGFIPEKDTRISEKILSKTRDEGFLVIERNEFADYSLEFALNYPDIKTLLFYSLSPKFFPESILLFVDNDPESQIPAMIYLFEQVITYLVEKLDKLYYWTELKKLNNELEERVAKRTADLETVNRTLETKEKFIRSIYEASQNVSLITIGRHDGELLIDSFSPGSERLFGYAKEDVTGKSLSSLLCGDAVESMGLFELGDRDNNHEVQLTRKSGELVHAMYNSYPISVESGNIVAELLVCIDISNLKLVQEQLIEARDQAEKADSLKTIFLQNMSHEIRTPLNAIVGFSDLLNKPGLDPGSIDEFTGIITRSSSQLLSLVNDILDISSIESGQYELRFETVNLRQLLSSLSLQFGPMARQKGLDFVFQSPEHTDILEVKSDFIKLQQVLINLIGNAIKFTEKGEIRLACEHKPGTLIISVSDSGIGIAKEDHKIIFDRFRQLDLSSARAYRGTGLGLYICKTYIELLGGEIWVESTLGSGSIFNISLPMSWDESRAEKAIEEPSPGELTTPEIKVLLAEDEDTNFMLMQVYMRKMNISITRAVNGQEAVEMVGKNKYDLVLMDIQMPVMNGLIATRKIREFNQDIPIIAVTAFAFANERKQALDAGCNEHLSKPVKQEVLEKAISKFVHRRD